MNICVLTNNNHLWLLPGFQYLWNKYCGLPVTIYGFDSPDNLFPNFQFKSLGEQLPAEKWSDGLLMMLDDIEDDYFIFMLEDYWLYEQVHTDVFTHLVLFLYQIEDDVLRIDLAGNRVAYKQAVEIGALSIANDDIPLFRLVETPTGTPYQMSFQAAIWHKENLREVLRSGENPWQSEIEGSKRVGGFRVLGTKPAVIKYQPVWQHRKWKLDKLKTDDIEYLKRRGWMEK